MGFEIRLTVKVFDELDQIQIHRHCYWPISTTEFLPP